MSQTRRLAAAAAANASSTVRRCMTHRFLFWAARTVRRVADRNRSDSLGKISPQRLTCSACGACKSYRSIYPTPSNANYSGNSFRHTTTQRLNYNTISAFCGCILRPHYHMCLGTGTSNVRRVSNNSIPHSWHSPGSLFAFARINSDWDLPGDCQSCACLRRQLGRLTHNGDRNPFKTSEHTHWHRHHNRAGVCRLCFSPAHTLTAIAGWVGFSVGVKTCACAAIGPYITGSSSLHMC